MEILNILLKHGFETIQARCARILSLQHLAPGLLTEREKQKRSGALASLQRVGLHGAEEVAGVAAVPCVSSRGEGA